MSQKLQMKSILVI